MAPRRVLGSLGAGYVFVVIRLLKLRYGTHALVTIHFFALTGPCRTNDECWKPHLIETQRSAALSSWRAKSAALFGDMRSSQVPRGPHPQESARHPHPTPLHRQLTLVDAGAH